MAAGRGPGFGLAGETQNQRALEGWVLMARSSATDDGAWHNPWMSATTKPQLRRFYRAFSDLVRAYQFRDRECTGEFGISVADWYPLELIAETGPLPMGELARSLNLDVSTVTRTIDRLERDRLVTRKRSRGDLRVIRVEVTRAGRELVEQVQARLMEETRQVLKSISASSRDDVTRAFELLLEALRARSESS